jgi:hypothetical protein
LKSLLPDLIGLTLPSGDKLNQREMVRTVAGVACLAGIALCALSVRGRAASAAPREVQWDYAPSGRDQAMGMDFDPIARGFTEPGPHQIGRVNKKAIYREYTEVERYKAQLIPRAARAYQLYLEKYKSMAEAFPQVLASQRTLFQLQISYMSALHRTWRSALALENFTLSGGLDSPMSSGAPASGINLPNSVNSSE